MVMARIWHGWAAALAACGFLVAAAAQGPEPMELPTTPVIEGQSYPDCRYDYRERNLARSRVDEIAQCIERIDGYYTDVVTPFALGLDSDAQSGEGDDATYRAVEARYREDRDYLAERHCRYAECEDYEPSALSGERDLADGMQQCGEPGDTIYLEGLIGLLVNRARQIDTGTNFTGALIGFACMLEPEERQAAADASDQVIARDEVGATAEWTSPVREDVSGSSTVVARNSEPSGATCLDITDVIIIGGEEERATRRMCRAPGESRYVLQG
jgi:surface antigen